LVEGLCKILPFSEEELPVTDWNMALKVFAFGFSGVFITLAVLMVAIAISGLIITRLSKGKEGK
jgi:cytochrome b subunit of formate dehydrogenase